MKMLNALFMLLGVILLLVLVCVLVLWFEKELPGEEYDERQKLARGKAYRVSFWVGVVYFAIVEIYLHQFARGDTPPVEPSLLLYAGLVIQLLVFHIYCLLTNSALPLSRKPLWSIGVDFSIGLIRLFELRNTGVLALTGEESGQWMKLLSCVFWFSLAIMQLIRFFWKEKE